MFQDNRVKTGSVIALLLGIPLTITLVLRSANNHYQSLPFFGPVMVSEQGDTTYHTLPNFEVASHRGDTLALNDELNNKNFVLHFFTAGCPGNCPEIFRKLKSLGEEYRNLDNLRILSVTLEPNGDSIEELQAFEEEMEITNDQWHLTKGADSMTNRLLKEGFLFKGERDTTRLQRRGIKLKPRNALFLVDKKGRIRGAYKGSDQQEFKKLKDEIRVLFVGQNLEYANVE
jgi:protein SCO1/2